MTPTESNPVASDQDAIAQAREGLPCPFCGSPAVVDKHGEDYLEACCTNRSCPCNYNWMRLSKWNQRPIEERANAKLDAARKAIEDAHVVLCMVPAQQHPLPGYMATFNVSHVAPIIAKLRDALTELSAPEPKP